MSYEVIYEQRSVYDGLMGPTGENPHERGERTKHRTYLGADFHRRFRYHTAQLGMRWVLTLIVKPGTVWHPELEPTPPPRYYKATYPIWSVMYFVRKRLDGLRIAIREGWDRDKRENW